MPFSLNYGNFRESMNLFSGDVVMKRMNLLLLALVAMLFLTACNTVQGVGKDIQAGGKAVEKVAK